MMKEFLISNWVSIALIGAFLIYAGYLVVNRKWDQLRGLAYKLILAAEKAITRSQAGQEKFNAVFVEIYSLIPAWLRLFVPPDLLKQKLQEWFDDLKDYLDNGKLDKSISSEQTTNV